MLGVGQYVSLVHNVNPVLIVGQYITLMQGCTLLGLCITGKCTLAGALVKDENYGAFISWVHLDILTEFLTFLIDTFFFFNVLQQKLCMLLWERLDH